MLSKPLAHFLIGPSPFKWMSIELIVFGPSGFDVVDQISAAMPGATPQVMETEGIVEQFRLIEPRGMRWCQPRSPPRLPLKVVFGGRCGMTGITVMNQKHTAQVLMALPKLLQRLEVMVSVFTRWASRLHTTVMPDQKHQHIDRAMADVLELLLFDRAGNRPTDGVALNRLEIGYLVDAGDPKAAAHQARGGGLTPQNLLRPLFEPRVQARRFPIARTMRLQVDLTQDTLHATGTDARYNPGGSGLASQILAGPMGNMQPLELTAPDRPVARSERAAEGEISIGWPERGASDNNPSSPACS